MDLKFQVSAKIAKPVREVYDAVHDPKKLSQYFTTGGASGPLDSGKKVGWDFAEFPGEFYFFVKNVVPGKLIEFDWEAVSPKGQKLGYDTRVAMTFEELAPESTRVTVSEEGWQETPDGLMSSYGNCHGWTQMLCCLKAFCEYGINLRKGYF